MNRGGRRVLRVDRVAIVELGFLTRVIGDPRRHLDGSVKPSLSPSRRAAAKGGQ